MTFYLDARRAGRHAGLGILLVLAGGMAACSRAPSAEAPPKAAPAKPAVIAAAAAPAQPAPGSAPPQPPDVPKEQRDALLRAILGEDYQVPDGVAQRTFEQDGHTLHERISFIAANRLPDGRTVVLVNALPADEGDLEFPSHATHGALNVYLLRQHDTGWEVLGRHEEVTTLGGYGGGGDVTWLPLGGGRQGFIITTFDMGQGYTIEVSEIFALGDEVQRVGQFQKASSNEGACIPETPECWDVDSTVRLADDAPAGAWPDILVDFKGKRYTVSEDKSGKEVAHVKAEIRQTARYRHDGKAYVLVSGTNPVPGI